MACAFGLTKPVFRCMKLLLSTIILAYFVQSAPGSAQPSLWAGGGLLSGGDDRMLPQVSTGVEFADQFYLEALFAGQRFSIVRKQTQIVSAGVYSNKLGSLPERLRFVIGVSFFREASQVASAKIASQPKAGESANQSETSYNAGLHLGLRYQIFKIDKFFASVNWESHLFPAGFAFIFLATGRRHVVSLSAGVEI